MMDKRVRNFRNIALFVPMTAEQETGYEVSCAKRILHYRSFFIWAIVGFQLYNIGYALFYTDGRLHTMASRVYTVLYTILLLASLGCFCVLRHLKKRFPENAREVLRWQLGYCAFLLLWGVCITVYDQRVSENISVYLVLALSIAVLAHLTPIQAVLTYGVCQLLLYVFLPTFKDSVKDSYGEYVNLTIMSLMCVFICLYRYYYDRKSYLYQQIIVEKNSHLEYLANRDVLTGLRNRRFLENEMDGLYGQSMDQKAFVTFMMLDVDSFKSYNDRYGHPQGDECLRRIGWRITQELDGTREYLIRYGGEEFLYIGFGVDRREAEQKGERFNRIIRELVIGPSDREPMGITVSIGLYTTGGKDIPRESWTDCVDKADKALYMAKKAGKDRCVCFSG